jgi:serine/threonine-protein kinase
MGVLYLALDPDLDRLVAIKLLKVDSDELRERFLREARIAARLQHPHIVSIYGVGEHDGQPYIAMEYISGETLAELIRRRAPLSLSRKLGLAEDLCEGLAFAHKAGIVHRDIKPANLMVSRDNLLKILDFGIARLGEAGTTQLGVLMGTPNYMSPEQVDGRAVDHRSDIFSVGLVLYELLVYQPAFSGKNQHETLRKILEEEPTPITRIDPSLDPMLDEIMAKTLRKRPEERCQDLAALQRDLARAGEQLMQRSHFDDTIPAGRTERGAPAKTPHRGLDLAELARRRVAQIAGHLRAAEQAMEGGNLDAAMTACEEAAMLDPHHAETIALLDKIRSAIEDRQAQGFLTAARQDLEAGSLTEAAALVEQALNLQPNSADAQTLRQAIHRARDERHRERERAQSVARALEHARERFEAGALESAIRAASEALVFDPAHQEALALRKRAAEAIEARERERRAAAERRAREASDAARERFAAGRQQEAVQALEQFAPPHPIVTEALADLQRELKALEERRRREEEERRRQEEERRRQEEERRRREEERRKQDEERRALESWIGGRIDAAHAAIRAQRFDEARAALEEAAARLPEGSSLSAAIAAGRRELGLAEEAAARLRAEIAARNAAEERARRKQPESETIVAPLDQTVLAPLDQTVLAPLDQTILAPLDQTILAQQDQTILAPQDRTILRPADQTILAPPATRPPASAPDLPAVVVPAPPRTGTPRRPILLYGVAAVLAALGVGFSLVFWSGGEGEQAPAAPPEAAARVEPPPAQPPAPEPATTTAPVASPPPPEPVPDPKPQAQPEPPAPPPVRVTTSVPVTTGAAPQLPTAPTTSIVPATTSTIPAPPAAVSPAPSPPEPPRQNDADAIRQTLAQWRAAYENLSIEQLASVWVALSGSQTQSYRTAFDACRSYTVGLADVAVQISPDGQTAAVPARVSYECLTRVGNRRVPSTSAVVFRMSRVGADWKISAIEQR